MRLIPLTILTAALAANALVAQADRRVVFSTYHGGDRNDDAAGVAVDNAGNIYVTGESESMNVPQTPLGGKPLTFAVSKGYLTKYAPGGKEVLWRIQIGGSSNTVPRAIALDGEGNVFVAGSTGARDLPLKNAVQTTNVGLNIAFLMKFNPKGELQFSTLFGGERNDDPRALATDSAGNVYMAGRATSTTFPVKNALQAKHAGSDDGFIAKFAGDGKLIYSTFLGGNSVDNITAIAVGPDDALHITGESWSAGLSTPGALVPLVQVYSSFAAKLAPEGDRVLYYTYLGWRGGYTLSKAIHVDADGRAWIGGHTSSKQLPTTPDAFQPAFGGGMRDGFALRLTADGTKTDYVTYFGGGFSGPADPDEVVTALRIDARGHLHLAGHTNSRDLPTHRAMQRDFGGAYDSFFARLDVAGRQLIYSTHWGGTKNDAAQAIAFGPGEAVTLVGETFSADLAPVNAVQTKIGSTNDAFVTQVCEAFPFAWSPQGFVGALDYTIGQPRPAVIDVEIHSACPQAFPATVTLPDASWLKVEGVGTTLPMKLKLTLDPTGLVAGEYTATIRVTVPDAFQPVLDVPVTLRVADPPPPVVE